LSCIDTIRRLVREGRSEITIPHFLEEMLNDDLEFADVEAAVARGCVRRQFTDDPRGTRYEIVGPARDGRQVAVIVRVKATGVLLLITTYLVE